jgi:hypothetical protein
MVQTAMSWINVYLGFPAEEDEQEVLPLWAVEKTLPVQLMAFAWFRRI